MTTIPITTSSPARFGHRSAASKPQSDRQLMLAAALFLTVAIVQGAIIVLAAANIADLGALYVTVT